MEIRATQACLDRHDFALLIGEFVFQAVIETHSYLNSEWTLVSGFRLMTCVSKFKTI